MKKLLAILMILVMTAGIPVACSAPAATENTEAPSNEVNLLDMYTVKDPEGVEYDQRVALYAPVIPSADEYADGQRELFVVFYGKDNQGVYMVTVVIFDTEENAATYAAEKGYTADGKAVISTNDTSFFVAMSSFIPDLQTWIDNNQQSGMIELD